MSTCRSCGAEIVWATVRSSGKKMPLDATATPDGNVWLHPDGFCDISATPSGDLFAGDSPATGVTRHTSHFATCPDADTHRKARR